MNSKLHQNGERGKIYSNQIPCNHYNYSNDGYSHHSAYSTSMTVGPIAHCIAGFNLNENDYVNAKSNGNGGYIYTGTSYTAAVTLPLYMPLEG